MDLVCVLVAHDAATSLTVLRSLVQRARSYARCDPRPRIQVEAALLRDVREEELARPGRVSGHCATNAEAIPQRDAAEEEEERLLDHVEVLSCREMVPQSTPMLPVCAFCVRSFAAPLWRLIPYLTVFWEHASS